MGYRFGTSILFDNAASVTGSAPFEGFMGLVSGTSHLWIANGSGWIEFATRSYVDNYAWQIDGGAAATAYLTTQSLDGGSASTIP
ncbi:hypothetical protein D6833_03190 [Candidatus Parcubacteria bacterium]|nr:MAG: hypothetical protein D6833_03190 [Candidatus Parcubacteria bacterium]